MHHVRKTPGVERCHARGCDVTPMCVESTTRLIAPVCSLVDLYVLLSSVPRRARLPVGGDGALDCVRTLRSASEARSRHSLRLSFRMSLRLHTLQDSIGDAPLAQGCSAHHHRRRGGRLHVAELSRGVKSAACAGEAANELGSILRRPNASNVSKYTLP